MLVGQEARPAVVVGLCVTALCLGFSLLWSLPDDVAVGGGIVSPGSLRDDLPLGDGALPSASQTSKQEREELGADVSARSVVRLVRLETDHPATGVRVELWEPEGLESLELWDRIDFDSTGYNMLISTAEWMRALTAQTAGVSDRHGQVELETRRGAEYVVRVVDPYDFVVGEGRFSACATTTRTSVTISRGYRIAGRVYGGGATPLSGVALITYVDQAFNDRAPPAGSHSARRVAVTDRAGKYTLTGIPAGVPVRVTALHEGHAPALLNVQAGYAGTCVEAPTLLLTVGHSMQVTLLTGKERQPVDGAVVHLIPGHGVFRSPTRSLTKTSGRDGVVRFERMPNGQYSVLVSAPGCTPTSTTVNVDETTGRWIVMLGVGANVVGRVVDAATGAPILGAGIQARSDNLTLPLGSEWVRTYADGTFRIGGVDPREASLTVVADGYRARLLRIHEFADPLVIRMRRRSREEKLR